MVLDDMKIEIEKLKKENLIFWDERQSYKAKMLETFVTIKKQQAEIKKLRETKKEVLPSLDTCYKDIPFPECEKECAFFVAGLSEMYKYIKDGK